MRLRTKRHRQLTLVCELRCKQPIQFGRSVDVVHVELVAEVAHLRTMRDDYERHRIDSSSAFRVTNRSSITMPSGFHPGAALSGPGPRVARSKNA